MRNHKLPLYAACAALLLPVIGAAGCQPHAPAEAATTKDDAKPADKDDEKKGGEKKSDEKAAGELPAVEVAVARVGTIETGLPATGRLNVPREAEAMVAAPVAGVLDALPVRTGQTVTRGQTLAHLSTRALQGQITQARSAIAQSDLQVEQARANAAQQAGQTRAAVLQAQAAVTAAEAVLQSNKATLAGNVAAEANARQNLARLRTLLKDGLVAQKDVDAAELSLRSAQAQTAAQKQTVEAQRQTIEGLRQAVAAAQAAGLQDAVKRREIAIARQGGVNARAALETATAQEALYSVRAPLSGLVTAVGASLGEAVDPATKIVTISNIDRLQLQIAVPAASAPALHKGQKVSFSVDVAAGSGTKSPVYPAVIRAVGAQVDPATNTVTAFADVDNRRHRFKDDAFVQVRVITKRHAGALLLPKSAVFFEPAAGGESQASVLLLDKDDAVHKTDVSVGASEEGMVEILSGIKAGARVAGTGGYGLAEGAKVAASDAKKNDAKGGAKEDAKDDAKKDDAKKEAKP